MFKYLFSIVIYLALAVWIGSIVFFGAGVASVLFQPDVLPSRTMAGMVNSAILGRLGKVEIVAGVLLVGGTLFTAAYYQRWLNWLSFAIALGMLATTAYTNSTLYPKMDALRVSISDFDHIPAEKMELKGEFDKGHKLYSNLEKGVLLAGVLVLILHTVAFVRHAEVQARRFNLLESEWRRLKDERRPVQQETRPVEQPAPAIAVEQAGPRPVSRDVDVKKAVATGEG